KSVELYGVKSLRAGVGSHAMYDEVEIILKLLHLRIVSILATVFDRQRMKLKDIEQHAFIGCGRRLHVDPDHGRLILQQLREICLREALLNFRNAFTIDENLHASLLNNTPKALANFSPGLERKRQPWELNHKSALNPERVERV